MFKHVVLWNIKKELNKEETIKEIKEKLLPLVDSVPTLNYIEVGVNSNDKDCGRDICLYTEFDDEAGYLAYASHPAHVAAGKYVGSVVCDRADNDYYI